MIPSLDQIAPYPREGAVTADRLAAALAAHSYLLFRRQIDEVPDRDRAEAGVLVNGYGVVYLLRHLSEQFGTEQADDVARELWQEWSDGEGLGIDLARWLREYGITPQEVADLAVQAHRDGGA